MIPYIRGLLARLAFTSHDGRVTVVVNGVRIKRQWCASATTLFMHTRPEWATRVKAVILSDIQDAVLAQTGCRVPRWRLNKMFTTWTEKRP